MCWQLSRLGCLVDVEVTVCWLAAVVFSDAVWHAEAGLVAKALRFQRCLLC